MPVALFWAVTLYDPWTRCELQSRPYPSISSQQDPATKANADGSIDLYFAPEKPAGTVTLGTKSDTWAVFASGWQYLHLLEKPRDLDPEDGRQDLRGLGAFYNEIGDPAARSLLGAVLDDSSSGAEAYYNIALMEAVALTFDAQWLNSGLRGGGDAFLLGCRLNVKL